MTTICFIGYILFLTDVSITHLYVWHHLYYSLDSTCVLTLNDYFCIFILSLSDWLYYSYIVYSYRSFIYWLMQDKRSCHSKHKCDLIKELRDYKMTFLSLLIRIQQAKWRSICIIRLSLIKHVSIYAINVGFRLNFSIPSLININ